MPAHRRVSLRCAALCSTGNGGSRQKLLQEQPITNACAVALPLSAACQDQLQQHSLATACAVALPLSVLFSAA